MRYPPTSGACDSCFPLASQLGDTRLHESLHKSRRWRIGQRKSNGSLRALVPLELRRMGAPDRRTHRVEAGVVLPRGKPHEWFSIEPEPGNPVTETLHRAW